MKFLRCPQFLFVLLDLRPELNAADYLKTFWIGYPVSGNDQTGHAHILQWNVAGVVPPTQKEVLDRWEEVKHLFVDPFEALKRDLTPREFRARFRPEEQTRIRAAAQEDHEVGLVYDDFLSVQVVSLDAPFTADGLALYVSKGLLSSERASQILNGEAA